MTGGDRVERDFFISHATVNRAWAEWIAVQLEQEGYSTITQSFDFRPGVDFLHQMHQATLRAGRTIAVLSPAYLDSKFSEAEWRVAFANDPDGDLGLLIPVRVQPCQPQGLLAGRVYVDLVDLGETAACAKILAAVNPDRPRPTHADYPGVKTPTQARLPTPPYPGTPPSITNLPARNPHFTGRDTILDQLYNEMHERRAAAIVPTSAIHGLGGIGKTQLALEYAHRYGSEYVTVHVVP